MSEQPTARPGGKKILGMSPTVFYVVVAGVAVVGGLVYFYIKNQQAAAAAAANTASTTTATGTGTAPVDQSGELSVIQSELEALLQENAGSGSTTTTGTTTTGTTTGTGSGSTPFVVAVPNGSGGWMEAVFPNQAAVNSYYTALGIQPGGGYPNGLNNAQITQAVQGAGGSIAGTVANSGAGGLLQ